MEVTIQFFVSGIPQPKGSISSFVSASTNRIVSLGANEKGAPWQATIAAEAMQARSDAKLGLHRGPVRMAAQFVFVRPKGHFGKGKNANRLLPSAPREHVQKPDRDKLLRALQDSLIGVLYADDSQVYDGPIHKTWGDAAGVHVTVFLEDVES